MARGEPLTRSEVMARIGSKETGPEAGLRKALWAAGLRGYRKNWGNPSIDVAYVGRRVAVFVDGCFWHGCPVHYREPGTNVGYWRPKIARNRERDGEVARRLREGGWLVIRLWTHLSVERMVRAVRLGLASRNGEP